MNITDIIADEGTKAPDIDMEAESYASLYTGDEQYTKTRQPTMFFSSLDLVDREVAANHIVTKGLPYRFPSLTKLVQGHVFETVDTWASRAGVGKSTIIADDCAMLLDAGHNVLFLGLEENNVRTSERVAKAILKRSAPKYWDPDGLESRDSMRQERLKYFTEAFTGKGELIQAVDPTALSFTEIIASIEDAVKYRDVKYVICDNNTAAAAAASDDSGDEWQRIQTAMKKFAELAITNCIHISLIVHTSESSKKGDGMAKIAGGNPVPRLSMNLFEISEAEKKPEMVDGLKTKDYRVITILKSREHPVAGCKIGVEYDCQTGVLSEKKAILDEEGGTAADDKKAKWKSWEGTDAELLVLTADDVKKYIAKREFKKADATTLRNKWKALQEEQKKNAGATFVTDTIVSRENPFEISSEEES